MEKQKQHEGMLKQLIHSVLLLLLWAGGALSAAPWAFDSSAVDVRTVPAEKLERYRGDPDFVYEKPKADTEGLFHFIWEWLDTLFSDADTNDESGFSFDFSTVALVGLILMLLGFVIYLANTRLSVLFSGKADDALIIMQEVDEDIHAMDLEDSIAEALRQGQYRRAIRLYYLKALRDLSERQLIRWKKEKTNSDYLRELRESSVYGAFYDITRMYDYIWYGEFDIDRTLFNSVQERFQHFSGVLNGNGGAAR